MDNYTDHQQDPEDVEDETVFDPNQRCEAILEVLSVEGNVQLTGDNVFPNFQNPRLVAPLL